MRTYKVLEAHLGDRPNDPYKPGDTRTMEPGAAKQLVDLKIIEPVDGEPAVGDEDIGAGTANDQIEALRGEVAEARERAEAVERDRDAARVEANEQIEALRGEIEKLKAAAKPHRGGSARGAS